MASKPSSQFRPTVSTVITKVNELPTGWEEKMDDLIDLLAEKNGTTQFKSDGVRAGFWGLVFDGGWNTSRPYMRPAPLVDRDPMQTQVQIGVLRIDCPEAEAKMSKKRKRDNRSAESRPSAERRAGAAAFVNAFVKEDEVCFTWTDQRGRTVSKSLVRLDEGLSSVDALSLAIDRWDTHETARVRSWNKNMAVFWARERLMKCLERRAIQVENRIIVRCTKITMVVEELVPLVLASELFETLAQTYGATAQLLTHRDNRRDGHIW